MRFAIPLTGIAAAALALAWGGAARAQTFPATPDTVDVAQSGVPNALYNAIAGDTLATGARKNMNRVYRLPRGARYLQLTSLQGNYPLNVVAATSTDPASKPPIIQRAAANDGGIPETISNTPANQTWKGVYFLSPAPTGTNSFFVIRSSGANTVLTFDNCTFDYVSGVAIQFDDRGGSLFVTNSRFRNFQNTEQIYAGRAAYFTVAGNADTPGARDVVFENNTFSNIGGFIFQGPRSGTGVEIQRFRFNHNTIVGVGLYPFLEEQWTNAQLTNNLFVNALFYGETVANRTGQDPEGLPYSIFNVNRLRTGQTTSEFARRIGVVANANYRDPRFDTYYASTPAGDATKLFGAPFFNTRTQDLFNSRASFAVDRLYEGAGAPGFTVTPADVDKQIQFRQESLQNPVPATRTSYNFDPDGMVNTVTWPLPEDLTYTNAAYKTGAIGGFPLGDLNWYPAEKAAWSAAGAGAGDEGATNQIINAEAYTNQAAFAEAEDVTLTGATNVLNSGDRAPSDADASAGKYVYMEGSGSLTWNFNVADAGSYSIRIRYQVPFDAKAQKVSVNGAVVPPNLPARSGDFFFTEPKEVWQFVDIPVTLTAGANELKIEKSYGYMYFDSFEVLSLTTAGESGPNGEAALQVGTYPNPTTTGRAQVRISLGAAATVGVKVFDLLGRQVLTVPATAMAAGADQTISLDGSGLPGGTYVYRVEARDNGTTRTATGRLTVIR